MMGQLDNRQEAKVPLIFELSSPGTTAMSLPEVGVKEQSQLIPEQFIRGDAPRLPEVSQLEVMRHFVNLSHLNMGIDTNFYPLGSCTMKFNPKVCD